MTKIDQVRLANFMCELHKYLHTWTYLSVTVWIVEFGKWDVRKIVEGGGQMAKDFDRYCNQAIWRLINSTTLRSTPDYPVSEYTGIVDFDGYSLQQLSSTSSKYTHCEKKPENVQIFTWNFIWIPAISFILHKARQLREVMKILEGGYCINGMNLQ